ncbi:PEP/pyruvate-binding domain-containing protein [Streptomyces sp. NPDC058992]|uniref:PEP/pyruvate-binding domain-containing protein n=1 Tax=Streptomyces sp. NPDC058992 TaxID=3346688 RepID=UPI00368E5B0C
MDIPALSSLRAADSGRVGGKAAGLGELLAIGLPVPPGFVLPAGALSPLLSDRGGLARLLASLVDEHGLRRPFAVRSSAAAEDGANASYAGQFASELGVGIQDLAAAVERCARSGESDRAAHYTGRMEADGSGGGTEVASGEGAAAGERVAISVIVQEQVPADLSGVLFTADPVTGDRESYLLDVVPGAGSALVGGETEPLSVRLSSDGMRTVNRPDWCDAALETRVLGLIAEIRSLGKAVTDHRAAPQDIELCVTADNAVIPVQARPITALPAPAHRDFALRFIPVTSADRAELGGLTSLDKVRLRLIAEENDLAVGRAWIVRARPTADSTGPDASPLPEALRDAPQISFVLQDPARLSGSIVRRFSAAGTRREDLDGIVQLVGAAHDEFALIATEVRSAVQSGVARRFDDRILVEIGFGAFVPKGVVTTSQYVCTPDGKVVQRELTLQERAFVIEDGQPRSVVADRTPELSDRQIEEVCRAVAVAGAYYQQPSVEFGITSDGSFFLIDFVDEDTEGAAPEALNVIAPGRVSGRVIRIDDDHDLLMESLDFHFHTDRSDAAGSRPAEDPVVVLARLPYLSLERFIRGRDPRSVGFVFRNCSYLSHLSIVLRELGIPALVDAKAFDTLAADSVVVLDSASQTVGPATPRQAGQGRTR